MLRLASLAIFPFAALYSAVLAQDSPLIYSPRTNLNCPNTTLVRTDGGVNPDEVTYLAARQSNIVSGWNSWIGDGSQLGYNLSALQGNSTGSSLPKVGIAISGGGYRAAQYGAGVISGLDGRNSSSVSASTGGLYQVASYITGLSGGSWFVSSLIWNNIPTIPDLVLGNNQSGLSGWQLNVDLLTPDPTNTSSVETFAYFGAIFESLGAKAAEGFPISFVDAWGRALGYHMFNGTTTTNFFTNSSHGAGLIWSAIPQIPAWKEAQMPFPIIATTSRASNYNISGEPQLVIPFNATTYEINPFEIGSWDPDLAAFANIQYVGTNFTNGTPADASNCVNGFDQASFVIGSSSDVFNDVLAAVQINSTQSKANQALIDGLTSIIKEIQVIQNSTTDDVASWPNPFKGIKPNTFADSSADVLTLVDGGEELENIPLFPLLQKVREVDVIVAVDGSADTIDNWPAGLSLYATQNRTNEVLSTVSQQLPPIPANVTGFVGLGLNQRPTFFGCDPTQSPPEWPLVIYLPNAPPLDGSSPVTNTNTYLLNYTLWHTSLFLDAAHLLTTQGFTPNSTAPDPNFGKCLQCAAIDRARFKATPAVNRSEICTQCFTTYCFNPNSTALPGPVIGRNVTFVSPGTGPTSNNSSTTTNAAMTGVSMEYKGVVCGALTGLLIGFVLHW